MPMLDSMPSTARDPFLRDLKVFQNLTEVADSTLSKAYRD